jgi:hypothetical protein
VHGVYDTMLFLLLFTFILDADAALLRDDVPVAMRFHCFLDPVPNQGNWESPAGGCAGVRG